MSAGGEAPEEAAAGCQILLIGPARLEPEPFARQLDDALAQGGIAGFVLRMQAGRAEVRAAVSALAPVCAAHAVALILQDDRDLVLETGVDGLHLSASGEVAAARAALGQERILGVSCGTSRHLAMVAGEQGADYIALGDPGQPPGPELVELIGWWSGLFVLPCLAEADITAGTCAALVDAGADFVAGTAAVWQHPQGPGQGVRALRQTIGGAPGERAPP